MRHIICTALFVCALASLLSAAEPQVNEAGKAWLKAIKANDVEALVAVYAPDAVVFPPDSMVAKGHAEIRKGFSAMLNEYTVQDFAFVESQYETVGDLSFARGLFRMTMAPKAGGDPVTMEGRFSDVSRLINGKWLYVVDHASVPLAPPAGAQTQHH